MYGEDYSAPSRRINRASRKPRSVLGKTSSPPSRFQGGSLMGVGPSSLESSG
jgi:hypothetical protein